MHSRTQSKVEPPAKQSKNQLLQQRIPWWKDLEKAVYAETNALFQALIEEGQTPGTLLYARKTGAINMATSKRAALKLERETYIRGRAGLHAELWTPAQVAEATQGRLNTRSVVNAMWLPDEGRIHPLTLLAHLAQQARQIYNVAIAGQAQVTQYEPASP